MGQSNGTPTPYRPKPDEPIAVPVVLELGTKVAAVLVTLGSIVVGIVLFIVARPTEEKVLQMIDDKAGRNRDKIEALEERQGEILQELRELRGEVRANTESRRAQSRPSN